MTVRLGTRQAEAIREVALYPGLTRYAYIRRLGWRLRMSWCYRPFDRLIRMGLLRLAADGTLTCSDEAIALMTSAEDGHHAS